MDPSETIAQLVATGDRDRWLATLYAPAPARGALLAIHALDLEFAKVAATTTEPLLGEIRLAWWRERLESLDRGEVPAQPLLQMLAREVVPRGVTGARLAQFEDAWRGMLAGPPGNTALALHIAARAHAVFGTAVDLIGSSIGIAENALIVDTFGLAWAAGEAARGGLCLNDVGALPRAPAALRPLAGLAVLGVRDRTRAATGRAPEPRASVARQWVLLRAAMTGR